MSGTTPSGPAKPTRVIRVVFEFDLDIMDKIGGGFPSIVKAAAATSHSIPDELISITPLPEHPDAAVLSQRLTDLALVSQALGYASGLALAAMGKSDA